MKRTKDKLREMENLSAISAEFHTSKHYRVFYNHAGGGLGGFPGIWTYVIEVADAFSWAERKRDTEDAWIESVIDYAEGVVIAGDTLTVKELRKLALKIIREKLARE